MAKREIKNPAAGLFNTGEPTFPAQLATSDAAQQQTQKELAVPAAFSSASVLVVPPPQREARSQRKQILLQPSLHDRAEVKCKKIGISMNEAINQLLENWVDMD